MMSKVCNILLVALGWTACALSSAQSTAAPYRGGEDPPNFFEVQQYDQPFAGWAEPTLWTTHVGSSAQRFHHYGMDVSRQGMWAHSLEFDYGATDRLAFGSYVDLVDPREGDTRYAQTRLVGRYRFSDRQELFVNPALYVEYYLPDKAYGDQQLEARFIADKDVGDFRVVANPTLSVNTTGDKAWHAPSVGLSGGLYWRQPRILQPGLEYYADYGPLHDAAKTKQYLLPTVDVALTPGITWHTGLGFGLNAASDHFVIESQLRFEFNVVRPSRLFGH
jgi:hypothetical protein